MSESKIVPPNKSKMLLFQKSVRPAARSLDQSSIMEQHKAKAADVSKCPDHYDNHLEHEQVRHTEHGHSESARRQNLKEMCKP